MSSQSPKSDSNFLLEEYKREISGASEGSLAGVLQLGQFTFSTTIRAYVPLVTDNTRMYGELSLHKYGDSAGFLTEQFKCWKDMIVISDKLTTGQVTFILRVIIQIFSYGGLFLIGLIILGNTPRLAPLDTHDILNRVVGKSTVTTTSLKWIFKRIFRRKQDPVPSSRLLLALTLSLCYGLFVSLSDIGFIGFHTCTVSGSSSQDFPASVKTDEDALAIVSANLINGTDPHTIKFYRCDSAQSVVINANLTERICSSWHNITFGQPPDVRILNSTDTDILMARSLAYDKNASDSQFVLNSYFMGASGEPIWESTIREGIAVFPHDTGVRMISGIPQLSKQQRVDIPKILVLEADIGCMTLGTLGQSNPLTVDEGKDYFIPDKIYNPDYNGPEVLRDPLRKAAGAIRDLMVPLFNTSDMDTNGYYTSFNRSYGLFSWQTIVDEFFLPDIGIPAPDVDVRDIMGNCATQIDQLLNISMPLPGSTSPPSFCVLYQLRGSFISGQSPVRAHKEMVCATTTQVNMASAIIEMDAVGLVTHNITRIPSDLHTVQADYFEIIPNTPAPGHNTWSTWDPIYRYTLSDNPAGLLNHYIYQEDSFGGATQEIFSHGAGGIGLAFARVGDTMLGISSAGEATIGIVDSTYFSATNFSPAVVTKLGGAVGASFLLTSVGYNGWAARGSTAFTVVSTGGQLATCYNSRFAAAFLPLVLAALTVLSWTFAMLIASGDYRVRATKRLNKMYGGLSPTIITPFAGKPPPDTLLAWETGPEPHLKPIVNGMTMVGAKSEMLVSHLINESSSGYGMEK
ncbi:hypothetical protein GALMADRAFT_1363313 [Galerina marginata CBS 339.88]|uniref:Uncharacterized protein n=1 Tax=Galerina marginata (strain CBS 339.88) TaxID=685588 RepID=A0A067T7Y2_GALM3|nr:hypothetical protein GALMADRAFT_1363313 [Galerina marginata CBS 339.88]